MRYYDDYTQMQRLLRSSEYSRCGVADGEEDFKWHAQAAGCMNKFWVCTILILATEGLLCQRRFI